MIDIKKYCKEVDITEIEFIEQCCFKYLKGKWSRNDVQRLLVRYSHYSFREIEFIVGSGDKEQLYFIVRDIAEHMSKSIITKELNLRPIRYHVHIDGMNKKERVNLKKIKK